MERARGREKGEAFRAIWVDDDHRDGSKGLENKREARQAEDLAISLSLSLKSFAKVLLVGQPGPGPGL